MGADLAPYCKPIVRVDDGGLYVADWIFVSDPKLVEYYIWTIK